MDRDKKVNNFVSALEGLSSSINDITFKNSLPHLENLESSILSYINNNYPTIVITKEDLKKTIDKTYQEKHLNLKSLIDKNIGLFKYNIEDANVDVDKIIHEEIEKYKVMFMSIQAGTNVSYLGLVGKCTQDIMGLLIRKNTSISFAKNTEEVRNYITEQVNDCFFKVMIAISDTLLDDGIIPIEEDFKINNGKSKIKTEEF